MLRSKKPISFARFLALRGKEMERNYAPLDQMKKQKVDFMSYQYEEIGHRIKEFRLSQGLGQDDFSEVITNKVDYEEKEVSIQPNVLSAIENGKIFGKNKNFLPEKTLRILSNVLGKTKEEIIFGDEKQLKAFVMKLYYQIVVNVHPVLLGDTFPGYLSDIFPTINGKGFDISDELKVENPEAWMEHVNDLQLVMSEMFHTGDYYYYELYEATQALQKTMQWYAPLAYVQSVDEIGGKTYYNYDKDLLGEEDDFQYYIPTRDENASLWLTYFAIAKTQWEMSSRELVLSFRHKILKDNDKIKFSDLNRLILNWVNHDFIRVMQQLEKRLEAEELYSMGYHVYNLISPVIKTIENPKLSHKILVEEEINVEYVPRIWGLEHLADEVFKDTKSLTNDIDLTARHSEPIIKQGKKEMYQRQEKRGWNRDVYKEDVNKSLLFTNFDVLYNKYNEEGKVFKIPELLGSQRFVASGIKNLALLRYAQSLTYLQVQYLSVLSREEFIKYFNVEG